MNNYVKIFATASLIVLLTGCGWGAPPNSANPSLGEKASPIPGVTALSTNNPVAFDVDGLHIQTATGIRCSDSNDYNAPYAFDTLVLTGKPSDYGVAELQQMATYIDSTYLNEGQVAYPPPPSSLSWVPVVTVDDGRPQSLCVGDLEITNTGMAAIQIVRMDMRLTQAVHRNTFHYSLVDACPFLSLSKRGSCPFVPATAGEIQLVEYRFALDDESADMAFQPYSIRIERSEPSATDGLAQNGALQILDPAQTISARLYLSSSGSRNNFVYSMIPELVVKSQTESKTETTILLPQLMTIIAFASPSQFSCYTLEKGRIVPVSDAGGRSTYCI
jgi:hypothetical protein